MPIWQLNTIELKLSNTLSITISYVEKTCYVWIGSLHDLSFQGNDDISKPLSSELRMVNPLGSLRKIALTTIMLVIQKLKS